MAVENDPGGELVTWTLDDGEEIQREAPATFSMPPRDLRESLRAGDIVKLIFRIELRDRGTGEEYVEVERMWVSVTDRTGAGYRGELDNDPYCTTDLRSGERVLFEPRHVIQIYDETAS
jgi:hypothetical protein